MSPSRVDVLEGKKVIEGQTVHSGQDFNSEGIDISVRSLPKSSEVAFRGKDLYFEVRKSKPPHAAVLKGNVGKGDFIVNLTEEVSTIEIKRRESSRKIKVKHIPQ